MRKKSFVRKYKPEENTPTSRSDAWQQAFDFQSNTHYWVNLITGEFEWERPAAASTGGISVESEPQMSRTTPSQSTTALSLSLGRPRKSDWEEVYDDASDSSYFINCTTGQFSRTDPTSAAQSATSGSRQAQSAPEMALWKPERDTESGDEYWVDLESGRVVYTKPVEGTVLDPNVVLHVRRSATANRTGDPPSFLRKALRLRGSRQEPRETASTADKAEGPRVPMTVRATDGTEPFRSAMSRELSSENPLFAAKPASQ